MQLLDTKILVPYLPPKYDYVVLITISALQSVMIIYYLKNVAKVKQSVPESISYVRDYAN